MKVKINKLNEKAQIPVYSSACAAGADLYYCGEDVVIEPSQTVMLGTGIAMEIPDGFVGLVYARSGLACKSGLAPANKVGVIDSDYRGEIMVAMYNDSSFVREIEVGDRIAQIIIELYAKIDGFTVVEELSETTRGSGGFGSTGQK